MYRKTVMSSAFKGLTKEQPCSLHLSKLYQRPDESFVKACVCNMFAVPKTAAKGNYMHETPRMSHGDGGDQVVTNNPIRKKIAFFLISFFFNFSEYVIQ